MPPTGMSRVPGGRIARQAFTIAGGPAPDDLVLERDGATVVIDPMSVDYMRGAEIDFVDDLIGQSFKIENPNATASCGCGTSFAL